MAVRSATTTSSTHRAPRRRGWAVVVYMLFFLSGMTSLIYEVVWVRKFGLVFGVTTYAVSTVLAAFFAGLAVGSYVAGRLIDRTRVHPLLAYGLMEGLIGGYALLLPLVLRLIEATYPAVYAQIGESFSLFTLYRFAASFVLLGIPTTLMGATLPVLSKLMVEREDALGLNVGRLYAANTFGAVAGTFSAGFLFIPVLGMFATTVAAAIGNFFLAMLAILISSSSEFALERRVSGVGGGPSPTRLAGIDRIILGLAFASGVAIIALEVVWTRSLVLVLGSTTYAFSTMLTAVLVGIALGSAVFAPIADRSRNRAALVALLLFLGGGCAAMGPAIINRLPFIFLQLYDWAYGAWALVIAVQFVVCFLLVFIPTFLSGASFPILVRMYSLGEDRVGRTVADVYSINTLGGIIGSLLGGFVLVKYLGLQQSLTAAALFLMLVGGTLAVSIARPWRPGARVAVAAAIAAAVVALIFFHPRFETKLLFAGWGPYAGGYYAGRNEGSTVDVTDRHSQRLLYHKEGVTASVDVMETAWGDKIISVNAKPVATTYLYDMRALRMLGHLPMLLHRDPKDVLIIGLGAGVSIGIIADYPSVEHVTTVELCEEVPGGTEHFAEWNHNALDNPKLDLVINDGANYVKATREQYDVISADPIHPFVSGAGTLYSYEHWQTCRDLLREGGILAQWLPLYHLSASDFATIVRTFCDVFPDCSIWFCGIDTVLIGAKDTLTIDLDRMREDMSDPVVMADLLDMGVHAPGDVLGWYAGGPEQMREMGLNAARNTTDLPIIEFSAPKAVALTGVAATMPAVLTAFDRLSPYDLRTQLSDLCAQSIDAQTLYDAANARRVGRWLARGQLLYSYNYPDQYLEAVQQAYSLRPNDRFVRRALADAQYSVAEQRVNDGYPRDAYPLYCDSYLNDSTSAMALVSAVKAAIQAGDKTLADQALKLAVEDHQNVFDVLVYRGYIELEFANYEEARTALDRAAALEQESPTMHVCLGSLDLRDGSRQSAHRHFDRALEISTTSLHTAYDIVDMCQEGGFVSDALPYADLLVRLSAGAIAGDPAEPYLYGYRALGYSVLGENRLAARDMAAKRSLLDWWQVEPEVEQPEPIPSTPPAADTTPPL